MKKLNKIFAKSEEKFTKSVILYPGVDDYDPYIYVDRERTERITRDALVNLYMKKLIILEWGVEDYRCGEFYEFKVTRPTNAEPYASLDLGDDLELHSAEFVYNPGPEPN